MLDCSLIEKAIIVAARAHKNQLRKGTDVPYITHPYAVGILLMNSGCEAEVVAAGILHDTVEDTSLTLEDIKRDFGDRIAAIVEGCSEPDKSLSWEERKRHTIEYLKNAPLDIKMVSCADKLSNMHTVIREYKRVGEDVWKRFRRGRELQEWYFRELVKSLLCGVENWENTIFEEFKNEVEKFF